MIYDYILDFLLGVIASKNPLQNQQLNYQSLLNQNGYENVKQEKYIERLLVDMVIEPDGIDYKITRLGVDFKKAGGYSGNDGHLPDLLLKKYSLNHEVINGARKPVPIHIKNTSHGVYDWGSKMLKSEAMWATVIGTIIAAKILNLFPIIPTLIAKIFLYFAMLILSYCFKFC